MKYCSNVFKIIRFIWVFQKSEAEGVVQAFKARFHSNTREQELCGYEKPHDVQQKKACNAKYTWWIPNVECKRDNRPRDSNNKQQACINVSNSVYKDSLRLGASYDVQCGHLQKTLLQNASVVYLIGLPCHRLFPVAGETIWTAFSRVVGKQLLSRKKRILNWLKLPKNFEGSTTQCQRNHGISDLFRSKLKLLTATLPTRKYHTTS